MKKFLFINILLLSVSFAFAQELVDNDSVCSFVDERAQFVGGEKAMMKWLSENMPPSDPRDHIQGTVFVKFVVEKDGSTTNIEIVKSSYHKFLNIEAVKIVKKMPKWLPAKKDGKIVRSYLTLPIRFILK